MRRRRSVFPLAGAVSIVTIALVLVGGLPVALGFRGSDPGSARVGVEFHGGFRGSTDSSAGGARLPGAFAKAACPTQVTGAVGGCRAQLASTRPASPPLIGPLWINVTEAQADAPRFLLWDSLVYDPIDQYLVLFGGCTVLVCPFPAQTWTYSADGWRNITNLSPQPPARSYSVMTFDGADGYVLLSGGGGATSLLGDTWSFVGGVWTNRTGSAGPGPSPRWGGAMAYDPIDRQAIEFGGADPTGKVLGDTWAFSQGRWSNVTQGTPPSARWEATMVWDNATGKILMMDGCGSSVCPLNDSWEYLNGHWTNGTGLASPLPPARALAAMTFDAGAARVRLFGGFGVSSSLADTWEFSNGSWYNATALYDVAPHPREGAAIPADTVAWTPLGASTWPYIVLFGGDWMACTTCPLNGLNDTWVFETPPRPTIGWSSGIPEEGRAVSFAASIEFGAAPFRYSWSFGDGDGGTGAEPNHTFARPGVYLVNLSVTDGARVRATASVEISVQPPSSGGTSARWLGGTLWEWQLVAAAAVGATVVLVSWRILRRPPPEREPDTTPGASRPPREAPPGPESRRDDLGG